MVVVKINKEREPELGDLSQESGVGNLEFGVSENLYLTFTYS